MEKNSFIKNFEEKVKRTIKKYNLLNKKEKVLVAFSGGKDSTTLLYILKKLNYNVEAIHINLLIGPWSKENEKNTIEFCKEQNVRLHLYSILDEIGYSIPEIKSLTENKIKNTCIICGILKKTILNKKARHLGFSKIATGHNLDDEAQTALMNLLKGNPFLGVNQWPSVGLIKDKKFIPRVKPLFFCKEKEIEKYARIMNFPVMYEKCPYVFKSFRHEIRQRLDELEKKNRTIKENILLNWLKLREDLIKMQKINLKLIYCERCGEPARKKLCKACNLLLGLKRF